MNPPNVILLTIDTLRSDMLGCYGNKAANTPNIDRLAASGIRFAQAITGGSWTQAAFPVLLTSSYAGMYGGCLGRLSQQRPSPVATLAEHGYRTGGFTTNLHLSRLTGFDFGFEDFSELIPAESHPRLSKIKGGQHLLRLELTHLISRPLGIHMRPARLYGSAEEVTDSLCEWLVKGRSPFFAWTHYMDLHWPYHMEESLAHPPEIAQAWRDLGIMYGRANFDRKKPLTLKERERFIGLYQTSLQYLDAQIGRLINFLEEAGLIHNTVVILVSDHGEEFLDHGRWGHWESNLFDEILRVPMVVLLPVGPQGKVISQQVSLLDLMPTILDVCGIRAPAAMSGKSLAPLWESDEQDNLERIAICEMRRDPWHRIAVRTESYKYIWDNQRTPELYELTSDPSEKQNVWQMYPDLVGRFQAIVDEHLDRVRRTEPAAALPALELDTQVVERLRDLGYF